jgi:hypothetical protein
MELLASLAHDSGHGPDSPARRVIVVTHSVQSLELCDQVIVLCPGFEHVPGGRVAYDGPPDGMISYFGVDDAAEVFRVLENPEVDWGAHADNVAAAAGRGPSQPGSVPNFQGGQQTAVKSSRERAQLSWRQQLELLTRRYVEVITADRANLTLIAIQAPVIGLMLALITSDAFVPPATTPSTSLLVLLLGLVLSITYIGASNSIREIVKERSIYRRERALGLLPVSYVGSKLVVLAALTTVQALALTFIATRTAGQIPADNLFGEILLSPFLELFVVVTLTGVAAVCLGLFISSLVTNADKATSILPVVLLAMYLLSGGPTDVDDSPALGPVSVVNSARWGLTASAKIVDAEELLLCNLGDATVEDRCRDAWDRDSGSGLCAVFMLAALSAAAAGGAVWVLEKRPLAELR